MKAAWIAMLAALVLSGCASVPFGGHTPLEPTPAIAELRAALPKLTPCSQSRWRATLHLGEPMEVTLLVRVDVPGRGRVLAMDDLGNRLFDIGVHFEFTEVHDLARGLPQAPLVEVAFLIVDALSGHREGVAGRTDDGRLALLHDLAPSRCAYRRPIGGLELRASLSAPGDLRSTGGSADDAVWVEVGRDGDRLGWARLQGWTPEAEGGFVYPAQLRIGVPGDHERLDARILSWKSTTPSTSDS